MFNPVLAYIRTIGVFNFVLRMAVMLCLAFMLVVIFAGLFFIWGF